MESTSCPHLHLGLCTSKSSDSKTITAVTPMRKDSADTGESGETNSVGKDTPPSEDSVPIEVHQRGQWIGKLDFIFSCINYAVGLGNVWRFPYLCYENGGGAFLFPYLVCLIVCGIPSFFLEVALGQYLSLGGLGIWKLVPIFKGVGYASITICLLYNIYFIVIDAWILFYLVSSFAAVLPWQRCDGDWNTELCRDLLSNYTLPHNSSDSVSPIVEFWERRVLGITTGIENLGVVRWELALFLLLAWFLVYIVIWRGLHQSGKIIWITALFPYMILAILFIRGITLDGAVDGILYYVTPVWEKLLEPGVWVAAGTQVFFTFGIGFGSVITLGSYNKFHHNFYRDSLILCFVNPATSIFAGFVIFSVLGYMSHIEEREVADVVKSGPGLAFLAYPEVVIHLPLSPLWSVLFFLMLLILGTNSQFCTVEGLITGLADEWASVLHPRRRLFTLLVCAVLFLLGLPLVTEGGMYLFQIMDFYSASGITLLFTVFFQNIAISWVYGVKRMAKNIKDMIGRPPSWYFIIGWMASVPIVTVAIFLFSVIRYRPLVYAKVYTYPWWGEMMGWGMGLASMLWIPCYAIYYVAVTPGCLKERIITGITPNWTCDRPAKDTPDEDISLDVKENCNYNNIKSLESSKV